MVKATQQSDVQEMGIVLRSDAQALVIVDQPGYDAAAEFLTAIKTKIREVEAAMEPQVKAAYNSWQVALKQKKGYLKPYEEAEATTKRVMGAYQIEQRRLAAEAEEQARRAAEKAEEAERKRLLSRAARCKDEDRAAELTAQAESVFVPVVAPTHEVTKAEGTSTSFRTAVEIMDTKGFLQWLITSGLDLDAVITVKMGPVEQYVKLTKAKTIPGCRLSERAVISAKGRA